MQIKRTYDRDTTIIVFSSYFEPLSSSLFFIDCVPLLFVSTMRLLVGQLIREGVIAELCPLLCDNCLNTVIVRYHIM